MSKKLIKISIESNILYIKKIFYIFLILFLQFTIPANSIENKILLKVDNEIITSIDILNEINYLKSINNNLNSLDDSRVFEISKNSLIKDIVRKSEIKKKNDNLSIDPKILDNIMSNMYKNINLNSLKEFEEYLNQFGVKITYVKNKIINEILWNEFIYKNYFNKVVIDEKELKIKLENKNQKKLRSFFLKEILYTSPKNQDIKNIHSQITKDIAEKGFENAVLIHSLSNSSNNKGEIGWVSEDKIAKNILDELLNLKIGEYTKPIIVPGGFLILKIDDIKEIKDNINLEKKIEEFKKFEINRQLNNYSNIYYNKVKQNVSINEL